jgi:hypothetical protein
MAQSRFQAALKRGFQTQHAEMDSARLLGDLAKGQATAAPTVRLLREDILLTSCGYRPNPWPATPVPDGSG